MPDVLDGETVDDDISLATLVSLHGVDADVLQFGDAEFLDALSYHGYLVAIWHDDSYGLLGVEVLAIEAMDAAKDIYHDGCLAGIDLVGNIRLLAKLRWDEYHAMGLQYIIERILRWKRVCQLCLQLMRGWEIFRRIFLYFVQQQKVFYKL